MSEATKDFFKLHAEIMEQYKAFSQSFVDIDDPQILKELEKYGNDKSMWPEPLIQFNPSYQEGCELKQLVDEGLFDPRMNQIFNGFHLYKHQEEALRLGATGKDFTVTSGTGSGKSLTFLGTIINDVLKNNSEGVTGLIVYPMNALINSQTNEIEKYALNYKNLTGNDFPVTFRQYTGQEDDAARKEIRNNPPHILLTNYMMLEYLLTRLTDDSVKQAIFKNLKFIAFDELHTYRGRQGADVAILIRRIKAECKNHITCMGTSATIASGETAEQRKAEVAKVASLFFGQKLEANQIIEESLKSISIGSKPFDSEVKTCVELFTSEIVNEQELISNPLFRWVEHTIALKKDDNILRRGIPLTLNEIASKLSDATKLDITRCEEVLKLLFNSISKVNDEINRENTEKGTRKNFILPYKLHQFISQSTSVTVTLHKPPLTADEPTKRVVCFEGLPSKNVDGEDCPLYPVVFSRTSGKPFICVRINEKESILEPRDFGDVSVDQEDRGSVFCGYLINEEDWNPGEDIHNIPSDFVEEKNGTVTLKKKYIDKFPKIVSVDARGFYSSDEMLFKERKMWYVPVGFVYDPTSGDVYHHQTSEFAKLTRVGMEGRSTSTTVLSLNILNAMKASGFADKDTKLLSFTDNRQDASLQAGHFNDFVNTLRIRNALAKALQKNEELDFNSLETEVFNVMNLRIEDYNLKGDCGGFRVAIKKAEDVFKTLLKYLVLKDLSNSWRINMPGLEPCGLMQIRYADFDEIMAEDAWNDFLDTINNKWETKITREDIKEISFYVLEYFRKTFAIYHESYYGPDKIRKNLEIFKNNLIEEWIPEQNELMEPTWMGFRRTKMATKFTQSVGIQSRLGRYVKEKLQTYVQNINSDQYEEFMESLLDYLCKADYLRSEIINKEGNTDKFVYILNAEKIIWCKGNGNVPDDPIFHRNSRGLKRKPNKYFSNLYLTENLTTRISSKEHTGQIPKNDRQKREQDFREGKFSTLFCSPTMELGIDISDLSIVHMRNVPPNPSNYAQRSGRAGRSGQPALVFTSCSQRSAHDAHYFNCPKEIVAGEVTAPKLDLMNQEMLKSHFNALFLTHRGIKELSQGSMQDFIIIDDERLPVKKETAEALKQANINSEDILQKWNLVIADILPALKNTTWYNDSWASNLLDNMYDNFEKSMVRWRNLYMRQKYQIAEANKIIDSGLYKKSSEEYEAANRNRARALSIRELLLNRSKTMNTGDSQSEFYPFRYLASEGFLPGYNFTRLPIHLLLNERNDDAESLSRPRNLALREMGPENLVYHNGSKYKVVSAQLSEVRPEGEKATVCTKSGYILFNDEQKKNKDPWTGEEIGTNREIFVDLMAMTDQVAEKELHITCDEEERTRMGYSIDTYFAYDGNPNDIKELKILAGGDLLLKVRYIPAAKLVYINKKWKNQDNEGFVINKVSGTWKPHGYMHKLSEEKDNPESKKKLDNLSIVKIYTTDTADALYIEPVSILDLNYDGRITLQYALKTAIEKVFSVESSEIGVTPIGDMNSPNILLYESAEESLGVMKSLTESNDGWHKIIDKITELCRFDDETYKDKASYQDFLSYYNQPDHGTIDRFSIQKALERLQKCQIQVGNSNSDLYETQYKKLLEKYDKNSSTEKKFLNYLYEHGLRLPDDAQRKLDAIYCQPDFYYAPDETHPATHIFCDGTPHDDPAIKERDNKQREAIQDTGDDYIVYYYKESLDELVEKRKDIFRKVADK